MKNWYASWFQSPYYHLLYKDRNFDEANLFLDNLIDFLNPEFNQRFLDIACGKGRHAIAVNKKGYEVEGIDLSQESIKAAKGHSNNRLHFQVYDMRKVYKKNHFDYVFNLFTSFGYFETVEENEKALNAIIGNLKHGGQLIIDFMNSKKVTSELIQDEIKEVADIRFHINRKTKGKQIIKDIHFNDGDKSYHFTEKVYGFDLNDFNTLIVANGMKILNLWGDYSLNDFDVTQSPRLIILAQKWN